MVTLTYAVCFFVLKRTADAMAPRLSVVFRLLVRLGSFPACRRQANVTPIPKGPPSSYFANYQPISVTSLLSKVFESLVSVRLGRFMESSGVLSTIQFAYRKGLGICDAILCLSITLQTALESGHEASTVQILISVQPLIGSTIRAFSIRMSSIREIRHALRVLEVLCCLY